jgi:membrane protease subunit HflC
MFAYTVKQHEQAVILAFGKVQGKPVTSPGLHFKNPLYEARKFDKRWLEWDGDPNQITTRDKRYISIDVFARWRIKDPLVFIEKLKDESSAQGRLDDIIDSAVRNVIANHNLIEAIRTTDREFILSEEEKISKQERNPFKNSNGSSSVAEEKDKSSADEKGNVAPDTDSGVESGAGADSESGADNESDSEVSDREIQPVKKPRISILDTMDKDFEEDAPKYKIKFGRQVITRSILKKASAEASKLGIELKDVRIKRIDYIASVQASVFDRMISERQKVATRLRSQGEGLSAEILGQKERELKAIRSKAYRMAEEIKGEADAEAANIYAKAYQKDPELYKFLKTLESYRKTVGEETWLIMTTDSEWARYFSRMK